MTDGFHKMEERARADFAISFWEQENATLRERIAREIESLMLEPKDHCIEEYNAGLTNAARIARGGKLNE